MSDEGADEVGEGRRGAAERLAGALDEVRRGLRVLDHVEHDEGDDEPADDLLQAHRHLRATGRRSGSLRSRPVRGGPATGGEPLRPMGNTGPTGHPGDAPTAMPTPRLPTCPAADAH